MSRAEEAANKAYPVDDNNVYNYAVHLGFIEGYEKAEKDLSLTWEDIKRIIEISDELTERMDAGIIEPYLAGEQEYYEHYEEVLRMFNEAKERHD